MKKRKSIVIVYIIAILVICMVVIGIIFNTASVKRQLKSFKSDLGGGIERTVTVYDYNGKEIRHWTGKFDVSESEREIYFDDESGKRVVIHGGIVINEEQ